MNVLVLNQDYQPLSVCSVERSVILIFLDKAEMLHEHPNRFLNTINQQFDYPSVIRLKRYIRLPYSNLMPSRKNIIKRDKGTCQYCGSMSNITIDHVIPKSRGGQDTWVNLVSACTDCNQKKGNKTPEEARMPLSRKPFKPHHISLLQQVFGNVSDTWKPYLYMA